MVFSAPWGGRLRSATFRLWTLAEWSGESPKHLIEISTHSSTKARKRQEHFLRFLLAGTLADQIALDGRSRRSDRETDPNGQRDRQGALPLDRSSPHWRTNLGRSKRKDRRGERCFPRYPEHNLQILSGRPSELKRPSPCCLQTNRSRLAGSSMKCERSGNRSANIPEPERRAEIEEHFNKPDVEARMEEQAAARDARRTPEQREQRYRNYIRRKEQIKGAPTKS